MRSPLDAPAGWSARGLSLRGRTAGDVPFLRALYGAFRAAELAPVPWAEAAKAQFLDSQFALQTLHFDRFHPEADFLIVEEAGAPIGRLYLDRAADGYLIVDIGFLPHKQGAGLGEALLRQVQAHAARAGASRVWLHVLESNPGARRLYERLGFRLIDGGEGPYQRMAWPVS